MGKLLNKNKSKIVLVLDDVWDDSIIKGFKFNLPRYKILAMATSRTSFTQFSTYQLQLLNDHDAAKLFSYAAVSKKKK